MFKNLVLLAAVANAENFDDGYKSTQLVEVVEEL